MRRFAQPTTHAPPPVQSPAESGAKEYNVCLAVDKNGKTSFIASNDENDVLNITKDDDFTVGRDAVAPGKYLIGFSVTDFVGNTNDDFAEVNIK